MLIKIRAKKIISMFLSQQLRKMFFTWLVDQPEFFLTFHDITTFSFNKQFQAWAGNEGTLFNILIAIVKT